MKRRDVLRWMGMGTLIGAAARLPIWGGEKPLVQTGQFGTRHSFVPDVELTIRAQVDEVQILPGAPTRVWRFRGELVKGPAETLQDRPDSYLGPVIRLRKGQKVRVRFSNALPESTIVHWHGLEVPAEMDGHPHSVIASGKEFIYEFEVMNRAGTYWYHPHPADRTGPQTYRGLAGLLLVSDSEETKLALPSGAEEILCVIQDRLFNGQNQLQYVSGGAGMMNMMGGMEGFLGDRVLVNGRERPSFEMATRAYRFRLLNASNSRIYKLTWSDGTPMAIIGSDGGLLEAPIQQRYLTLAPAQRADLILDLSNREVGSTLELRSAPFPATDVSPSGMGMGRMMMQSAVPNGAPFSLLSVRVTRQAAATFRLPNRLSVFDDSWQREPSTPPRRITLSFGRGRWLLDGRVFDPTGVTPAEIVAPGSTHVWELSNVGGMMGMQMAHPIHLHGRQFRVLSRERNSTFGDDARVREGLADGGWRDTVLVMPGETVRLLVTFTRYSGLFLYHCHNLEHEDMGMMRNFHVTSDVGTA